MLITRPSKTYEDNSFNRSLPVYQMEFETATVDNTEFQKEYSVPETQGLIIQAHEKINVVREKRKERDSLMNEIMRKIHLIDSMKNLIKN